MQPYSECSGDDTASVVCLNFLTTLTLSWKVLLLQGESVELDFTKELLNSILCLPGEVKIVVTFNWLCSIHNR
jgi:hypothetical protein